MQIVLPLLICIKIAGQGHALTIGEYVTGEHVDGVVSVTSQSHFDYFIAGLYYGFAGIALLLNSFFYYVFKEKKTALYILLLCSIALSFSHADGILALQMPQSLLSVTGPVSHLLVGISSSAFMLCLFKGKSFYKRLKIIATALCASMLILVLLGAMANTILYYWADVVLFIMLGIYIIAGTGMIKDDMPIRIFLLCYTPLYITGLIFYILNPIGLGFKALTNEHMKASGMLEILAFLLVSAYKVYRLQADKKLNYMPVFDAEQVKNGDEETEIPDDSLDSLCALYGLTESELKVFKCIVQGMSNTEISRKLFISVNTVKYHNRNIYEKMDIKSKSQAVSKILSAQISSN